MPSTTRSNLRLGLIVGAIMATLYSLYALVVFLLSGGDAFLRYDTSFPVVVLTYYAAGILGGGLIGSLLPFASSLPGRILLGALGGLVVFFCLGLAMNGPFGNWSPTDWQDIAFLGLGMGGVAGALWRKVTGW